MHAAYLSRQIQIVPDLIPALFQILVPYGRRHRNYGVTASMLDMMSFSFLVAIQPKLEEKDVSVSLHFLSNFCHVLQSYLSLFANIRFVTKAKHNRVPSALGGSTGPV